VYGPVRTVVWEGSGREACPYPDCPSKPDATGPYDGPCLERDAIVECGRAPSRYSTIRRMTRALQPGSA